MDAASTEVLPWDNLTFFQRHQASTLLDREVGPSWREEAQAWGGLGAGACAARLVGQDEPSHRIHPQ